MYTIPRNQRLTIHAAGDSTARLARLTGNWDGNDVGLVFADMFEVERANQRWWSLNLLTGAANPLALEVDPIVTEAQRSIFFASGTRPTQPYMIDVGWAFVTWRRTSHFMPSGRLKSRTTDEVTIYINNWFAVADPSREDLDVARDAWFDDDFERSRAIVKKLIPHSYELFIAGIQREFKMLQEATRPSDPEVVVRSPSPSRSPARREYRRPRPGSPGT